MAYRRGGAGSKDPEPADADPRYVSKDRENIEYSDPNSKDRGFAEANDRADAKKQLEAVRRESKRYTKQVTKDDLTVKREDAVPITARPVLRIESDGVCPNVTIMDKDGKIVNDMVNKPTYKSKIAVKKGLDAMKGLYLSMVDSKGREFVCLADPELADKDGELYEDMPDGLSKRAREAAIQIQAVRDSASTLAKYAGSARAQSQDDATMAALKTNDQAAQELAARLKESSFDDLKKEIAAILHKAKAAQDQSATNPIPLSIADLLQKSPISISDYAAGVAHSFKVATDHADVKNVEPYGMGEAEKDGGKDGEDGKFAGTVVQVVRVKNLDSRRRGAEKRVKTRVPELLWMLRTAKNDPKTGQTLTKPQIDARVHDKATEALLEAWRAWSHHQLKKSNKGASKDRELGVAFGVSSDPDELSSSDSDATESDSDDDDGGLFGGGGGGDSDDSDSDDDAGADALSIVLGGGAAAASVASGMPPTATATLF